MNNDNDFADRTQAERLLYLDGWSFQRLGYPRPKGPIESMPSAWWDGYEAAEREQPKGGAA